MTIPDSNPEVFWNNLLNTLQEFVEADVQNSNPSCAVRYSWERSCGAGTARTEDQALEAIKTHKENRKEGCG